MMSLAQAAKAIDATVVGDKTVQFDGVSTDTRTLKSGQLFIALRGERFDGHRFLDQAEEKGAAALMVDTPDLSSMPQLLVSDTRLGLGQLGASWRQQFQIPVVAVTGSNGKTTVKEMTAAILACSGPVLATAGNYNNDIGMPLTLLRLRPQHLFAVIEMGANHHGEIDYMTRLARPTVAMITNAGQAHLEGFGSVEGVSRAKGEIYAGLDEDGIAVVNADDTYADYWRGLNQGRQVMSFGLQQAADVSAEVSQVAQGQLLKLTTPLGQCDVNLKLPGRHNVLNALAASAAAIAAGATLQQVQQGLESVEGVNGRLRLRPGREGALIIDDTYNANPSSLKVALEVLSARAGRRVLVLGDMGELGGDAELIHAEMGELARSMGVDALYCVGEHCRATAERFGEAAVHFTDKETLISRLRERMGKDLTLLVKGSRRMQMEQVVEALATDTEEKQ
ncbi:MAG: UDP-N-acetylmuramoyl-tripeptide--D-alanyl-D-alanine ligase [Gammaproteobacteria bacterium]|nr:UDP-N-acetylmuramoyl-tripeptide--D-alanyl-D-alanine ligase [Gammaproteobacteria bacterium]